MELIKKTTVDYYTEKYKTYGDSPQGVDWKDSASQNLRFKELLNLFLTNQEFSILDVGCGTGVFFEFIKNNMNFKFNYTGIDYVVDMVIKASKKYKDFDNSSFLNKDLIDISENFDYVVSSGVFNVKLNIDDKDWLINMTDTIRLMFEHCNKGIVFNVLTNQVDFTEDRLHYSDPLFIFDFCKKNLSRFVKLNQGYPLYEYTMAVYKEDYIKNKTS